MASLKVYQDQENVNREAARVKNVAQPNQKRAVLGALENKRERVFATNKQPLASKCDQENACLGKKPSCKNVVAPVIPVAQFQAFKVYEDGSQDAPHSNKDVLEVPKVDIAMGGTYTSLAASPMSVEKSTEKTDTENLDSSMTLCTRNKDLFFELEEYRPEIYAYLRNKEELNRPKANYMRKQKDITPNMRTILVDWLVEVSEEYKLQTETLHLAINYIDRFLSFMSVVRAKLQLVGTAAMFTAAKFEEIYPPDVGEFVYITDDTYSKRQVIRMEILLLKVLEFDLSIPTSYTFITAMSIACKLPEKVTFLAQYLSELALLETEPTLEVLPSVMACSAIAVARHTLEMRPWSERLEKDSGYKLEDLQSTIEFLRVLHKNASTMKQQAIQEKYKASKYLHVSSIAPSPTNISFD